MIKKENFVKSETYCPCFDGFYETLLGSIADFQEHDFFESPENINDDIIAFVIDKADDLTDYKRMFKDISKKVVEWFNDYFADNKMSIKFKWRSLISPKYYNYENDSINIKALYTTDFIIFLNDYICNNMSEFDKWIKERYTSHSGFTSFWSNDYQVWLGYLNKKDLQNEGHFLGTFLEFYFENEVSNIEEDIYCYCYEYFKSYGYIEEYINWSELDKAILEKFNIDGLSELNEQSWENKTNEQL